MKVSVSLPDGDVEFLDTYAGHSGVSRSAAVHQAIQALRRQDLGAEYAAAYTEWIDSGEADVWAVTTADGLEAA
jgi:hypothetical protein